MPLDVQPFQNTVAGMDPISGILGGGISLLGGFMQNQWANDRMDKANAFSAGQSQINRDFQADQAQEQMAFQDRMSSTAYQRSMMDMKAAGLNPILAYQKGGASTPSGASGGGSSASSVSPAAASDVFTPAMSTALQAMQMKETIANLQQTRKVQEADVRVKNADVDRIGAQIPNITQTTKNLIEENVRLRAEAAKAEQEEKTRRSFEGRAAIYGGTLAGDSGIGNGVKNIMQLYRGARSPTINRRFPSGATND